MKAFKYTVTKTVGIIAREWPCALFVEVWYLCEGGR